MTRKAVGWVSSNDLNRRGIATSTGKAWQTVVLRQMLLRWRNCGVRTPLGKEVGPGQWEPIIDQALWDAVQRQRRRGFAESAG